MGNGWPSVTLPEKDSDWGPLFSNDGGGSWAYLNLPLGPHVYGISQRGSILIRAGINTQNYLQYSLDMGRVWLDCSPVSTLNVNPYTLTVTIDSFLIALLGLYSRCYCQPSRPQCQICYCHR
jgi:hypothetical protein